MTNRPLAATSGTGRIRVEGPWVGGTLTRFGTTASMSTAKRNRCSAAPLSAGRQHDHGNEGLGYAFSAENPKRFFGGDGWPLTPQARLSCSKAEFDRLIGSTAPVSMSLAGFAGAQDRLWISIGPYWGGVALLEAACLSVLKRSL